MGFFTLKRKKKKKEVLGKLLLWVDNWVFLRKVKFNTECQFVEINTFDFQAYAALNGTRIKIRAEKNLENYSNPAEDNRKEFLMELFKIK